MLSAKRAARCAVGNPSGAIFVSYRRGDAAADVAWLVKQLRHVFGERSVFHDHAALHGSQDWQAELAQAVGDCEVFVAVVGPEWEAVVDGRPRLVDEHDWVRREIALGLERGKPIIPLLVRREAVPAADMLAEAKIGALRETRDFVPLRPSDLQSDFDGLCRLIERLGALCGRTKSPWRNSVSALLAVTVGVTLGVAAENETSSSPQSFWMAVVSFLAALSASAGLATSLVRAAASLAAGGLAVVGVHSLTGSWAKATEDVVWLGPALLTSLALGSVGRVGIAKLRGHDA